MKDGVSVGEATHVKTSGGNIERIVSKNGVDEEGRVRSSKEGGFSVVTESGETISMWEARSYLKE